MAIKISAVVLLLAALVAGGLWGLLHFGPEVPELAPYAEQAQSQLAKHVPQWRAWRVRFCAQRQGGLGHSEGPREEPAL